MPLTQGMGLTGQALPPLRPCLCPHSPQASCPAHHYCTPTSLRLVPGQVPTPGMTFPKCLLSAASSLRQGSSSGPSSKGLPYPQSKAGHPSHVSCQPSFLSWDASQSDSTPHLFHAHILSLPHSNAHSRRTETLASTMSPASSRCSVTFMNR